MILSINSTSSTWSSCINIKERIPFKKCVFFWIKIISLIDKEHTIVSRKLLWKIYHIVINSSIMWLMFHSFKNIVWIIVSWNLKWFDIHESFPLFHFPKYRHANIHLWSDFIIIWFIIRLDNFSHCYKWSPIDLKFEVWGRNVFRFSTGTWMSVNVIKSSFMRSFQIMMEEISFFHTIIID